MPRGKRKRSQYDLKVWFPDGGSYQCYSEHDLSEDKWREGLKELIVMLEKVVARVKVPA